MKMVEDRKLASHARGSERTSVIDVTGSRIPIASFGDVCISADKTSDLNICAKQPNGEETESRNTLDSKDTPDVNNDSGTRTPAKISEMKRVPVKSNEKSFKKASSGLFKRFHSNYNSKLKCFSVESTSSSASHESHSKLNIKKLRFIKHVHYSNDDAVSQNKGFLYSNLTSTKTPCNPLRPYESVSNPSPVKSNASSIEQVKKPLESTYSMKESNNPTSTKPNGTSRPSFIPRPSPKNSPCLRVNRAASSLCTTKPSTPEAKPASQKELPGGTISPCSEDLQKGEQPRVTRTSSLHSTPVTTPKEPHRMGFMRGRKSVSWFPSSPSSVKNVFTPVFGSPTSFQSPPLHRARSHEGPTLTIRIPRHQLSGEKGLTPVLTQPLMSPSLPQAGVHPRIVGKSKSLTTSMDKLTTPVTHRPPSRGSSSRESSSVGGSRGSTPSSARSGVGSRPASRRSVPGTRSPRTPERPTPDPPERRVGKSESPTGSEASLQSSHSVNSSTHSVNSSQSIPSVASSNTSVKSRTSAWTPLLPASNRASSEPPVSPSSRKPATKTLSKSGSLASTKEAVELRQQQKGQPITGRQSTSASLTSSSGDLRPNDTNSPRTMSRKSTPSRQTPPFTPNSGNHRHSIGATPNKKSLPVFNSCMSLFQVQEKLKKGEVIEGVLRINPKSYEDAYISAPDGGMDIYIGGVHERNTALHGDVVAALLNPPEEWKILHSQLADYLEEHVSLKALVYTPVEPHISAYSDNAFTTSGSSSHTPATACITNTQASGGATTSTASQQSREEEKMSVVVEEVCELDSANAKKKKKHRRGKKRKEKELKRNLTTRETDQDDVVVEDVVEIISCPLVQEVTPEVAAVEDVMEIISRSLVQEVTREVSPVEDVVEIISCPPAQKVAREVTAREAAPVTPDEVPGSVFVLPHELSECEFSDDEGSVDSLTVDLDVHLDIRGGGVDKGNLVKATLKALPESPHEMDGNGSVNSPRQPKAARLESAKKEHTKPVIESRECGGNPCRNMEPKIELKTTDGVLTPFVDTDGRNPCTKMEPKTNDGVLTAFVGTDGKKPCRTMEPKTEPKTTDGVVTDLTVAQVQRLPNWQKYIQRSAMVVRIQERNHPMVAAGILKPFADRNPHMVLFSPTDARIPRMKIQAHKCPPDFMTQHVFYSKIIYLAKIVEWNDPKFALGDLVRDIGQVGNIEAETEALLLENDVDISSFPEDALKEFPPLPWSIPPEELKNRTDLRDSIIFTIDPATARDLDDAVSCLPLPSGNFRVGVHIADVSYFVKPESALDDVGSRRGTSFYLVQKVIPMLPHTLSENLCSLNPGEDRLTFSVIWELTPKGEVVGEWFGRTVIRSCAKLSYDHVQAMIDDPSVIEAKESFPPVNRYSLKQICDVVNNLNNIAVNLRKKRMDEGSLRLDQLKLGFTLDQETKAPTGFYVQKMKASNKMIEEFMLLANISVAQKICKAFPGHALLRRHPPPHEVQLENAVKFFRIHGIYLDPTNSFTLNKSINKYAGTDLVSEARMQLIVNLCSKPMQFARYFCLGFATDGQYSHHYALNVPCYTHFTSPIRRYADIIVHRLLSAAIDPDRYPLPRIDKTWVAKRASHCNIKKQSAKVVQEVSVEMYLAALVRNAGEMVERGMVVGVLDRSVDVLVSRLGVIKRCYTEKLPLKSCKFIAEEKMSSLVIEWEEDRSLNLPVLKEKLSYFDCVTVILRPFENNALKFNAFLARSDLPLLQKVEPLPSS